MGVREWQGARHPFIGGLIRYLIGKAISRASAVIVSDVITEENIKSDFPSLKLKLKHIPIPVDTDYWSPSKRSNSEKLKKQWGAELTFLAPARIDWKLKAQYKMFKAFSQFLKSYNNARLLVINWGTDLERARKLIKDLGIAHNILFLPFMSRPHLRDLYLSVDVIIDQFRFGAIGTVGRQAMSCGKPLITKYDNSKDKDYFTSSPPVLASSTTEEIYRQMKKCIDENIRKRYGTRSRLWAIQELHWEKIIDRYISLYEETINQKKKS